MNEELSLRTAAFTDFEARAIYCDWLEERGDKRLLFWKYALQEKLLPDKVPPSSCEEGEECYDWGNADVYDLWGYRFDNKVNCFVPKNVIRVMTHDGTFSTDVWRRFGKGLGGSGNRLPKSL